MLLQKEIPKKLPPAYGPFKHGDPAHKGYNKTIGKNWPYIEDPEVDTVKYRPNNSLNNMSDSKMSLKPLYWKDPTHAISTPIKTIHDNFRNASRENSSQLIKSAQQFG